MNKNFIFSLVVCLGGVYHTSLSATDLETDIGNAVSIKEYNKMLHYIETHNVKEKDIIQTITLGNGKGIVDCIDFYKQPTMKGKDKKTFSIPKPPEVEPLGSTSNTDSENELLTEILFGNSCPKDTVGIQRLTIEEISKYPTLKDYKERLPKKNNGKVRSPNLEPVVLGEGERPANDPNWRIHSTVQFSQDNIGAASNINIWANEQLTSEEFSLSQLWVVGGNARIEVGVLNYSAVPNSRLFIYLAHPDSNLEGYYNTGSPHGFTMVNPSAIGVFQEMPDYSTMGGHQAEIKVAVYKHQTQGHWWVWVHDRYIGFYDTSLFSTDNLKNNAERVDFGGEITRLGTDMGSGRLPSEGYGYAAYQKNIRYVSPSTGKYTKISSVVERTLHEDCYDVNFVNSSSSVWGSYIYFGGSAEDSACTTYDW